jgi:uncharacterized membrane protein YeiH
MLWTGRMHSSALLRLVLDLAGTFAFAVNGALTAVRTTRLDIVGVLTLGMLTALGGGILRDVLTGRLPPVTFSDWRYLTVATAGALLAFAASGPLGRIRRSIVVADAAGLSLFAVTGAVGTLGAGIGPGQAIILGGITAVGGGTLRDVLIGHIPGVLRSELYAIPALVGAAIAVGAGYAGAGGPVGVAVGAVACFLIRMLGVAFHLDAPGPRRPRTDPADPDADPA